MDSTVLLQQLANGLLIGGTYALVAIGFTLVFGVARVLNLAHPEVFMVGGYAGMVTLRMAPDALVLAVIVAAVAGAAVGVVLEFLVLRPVRRGSMLAPLITSIGASVVIQSLVIKLFGADAQLFGLAFSNDVIHLGGVRLLTIQVAIFVMCLALLVGVRILVTRTGFGRSVRAVAEDPETARILAIDVNRQILLIVVLGSALAGIAGASIGAAYNTVSPFMGLSYGLKGLVAMILGGSGRVGGAAIAGILLGVVEALSVTFLSSAFRDVVAFGLVLVVLLVRPQGLAGGATAARL